MNIKQASEQSGVSAPNIRFYEKEGLLTPARRQGNDYRDYTAGDVRTLKLIRMLRMLDVPLPTIKAVLRGEQPLQQALQAQQTVLEQQAVHPEQLDTGLPSRREKLLRIARIVLPPVCTFAAIMAAGWVVTGGAGWLWLAALASGGVLLGRCMEKWL